MPTRVAIVGLGLIGGSVARALQQRDEADCQVVGCDRDPAVLRQAQADGAIAQGLVLAPQAEETDFAPLEGCALVLICLPTALIAPVARALAAQLPGAVLMDVASVKAPVMDAVAGLRFIGGHPMAGSERTGYACSTPRLFEDAVWCLVPPPREAYPGDLADDLAGVAGFVSRLHAHPLIMSAARHDAAVAAISHLPHVVASALVRAALVDADEVTAGLAAGGFRDITRIAASDGQLWQGISRENRGPLLESIRRMEAELAAFRTALERDDAAALTEGFTSAAELRADIPAAGHGALPADTSLSLDILDRPGSLARITTLLGDANISIRNLSILHARQYEGGRLRLYLGDRSQLGLARELLEHAGYRCED